MIDIKTDAGVAVLTLQHGKANALDIEFCEELTAEWLKKTTLLVDQQRQKGVDCFHARGYQGLR